MFWREGGGKEKVSFSFSPSTTDLFFSLLSLSLVKKKKKKGRKKNNELTLVNPASSRASRIAPTRPSIMSEGATQSAPALACETAWRHRNSTVSSLRISPSSATMPSCPSQLYGSSATSV